MALKWKVLPAVSTLAVFLLLAGAALAQSPVRLTVDAQATAARIPPDFPGLSFEASNLLPAKDGGYLFGPANKLLNEKDLLVR